MSTEAQIWADNWSATALEHIRESHRTILANAPDDSVDQDFHVGVIEDLTEAIASKPSEDA